MCVAMPLFAAVKELRSSKEGFGLNVLPSLDNLSVYFFMYIGCYNNPCHRHRRSLDLRQHIGLLHSFTPDIDVNIQ